MKFIAVSLAILCTLAVVSIAGANTTSYVQGGMASNVWYSTASHAIRFNNVIAIAKPGYIAAVCLRYKDTAGRVLSSRCSNPGQLSLSVGGSGGIYAKSQCMWVPYVYRYQSAPKTTQATASGNCTTAW